MSATFDRRAVRRPAYGVQIRARPRSQPFDTVIVDHAAAAGSGTDDTQALHRIDPATVRAEVEAAGFAFDVATDMLADAQDRHAINVFDPAIKGATDRFAYRFSKP